MAENEELSAGGYKTDPVYIEAKQKFADDYKKWNELSEEEKQSEGGIKLRDELSSTNDIIDTFEGNPKSQPILNESAEITPSDPAEVIDQGTHVEKVQVLNTDQMHNTEIIPGTIIVDPSVETAPVVEGPVVDPEKDNTPAIDPDVLNQPNFGLDGQGKEAEAEKDETDYHTELETKENTRYGAGKETLADEIEEGGASRHYPPSLTGYPSGFKNEYPR